MGFSSVARMVDGAMAAPWQANLSKVTERLGYTSAAELIAVSPWLQTVQQECKDAFELVTGRRGAKLGDKDDGDFKQSAITKCRAADTKENDGEPCFICPATREYQECRRQRSRQLAAPADCAQPLL